VPGIAELVEEYTHAVGDRRRTISIEIMQAADDGGSEEVLDACVPILNDRRRDMRQAAVGWLATAADRARGEAGAALRARTLELLTERAAVETDGRVRMAVAHSIARMRLADCVPVLMGISLAPDWQVAHSGLTALGRLGDGRPDLLSEITPFLIQRLSTEIEELGAKPDDGVTGTLISALGELDDARALDAIEKAYRASPAGLGCFCMDAGGRIALRNRHPVLDDLPHRGHELEITDAERARADALLREGQSHPSEPVREEAAIWLRMIAAEDTRHATELAAIEAKAAAREAEAGR
jgi:HEAT repeat protein